MLLFALFVFVLALSQVGRIGPFVWDGPRPGAPTPNATPAASDPAAILARRLEELGRENRRLLEKAVALQSRVIETIAGAALPKANAQGYAPAGRMPPARPPAIALSARA